MRVRLRSVQLGISQRSVTAFARRTLWPLCGRRVRASILKSFQNLAAFPHMGRRQTVEGVRKIVTRRYRYLVYYTVDADADEVVVVSIQHPARQREFQDA